MKVVLITKGGKTLAGASRIAVELRAGFTARGITSELFTANPTPDAIGSSCIQAEGPPARILKHLDWRLGRLGLSPSFGWELKSLARAGALDCDILHFHDVYQAISPNLLAKLAQERPVFLTVHDCSPFTGGCLYPAGCTRFTRACGECPQLNSFAKMDLTRFNLHRNRRVAAVSPIHYIFPSKWMQEEAEKTLDIQGRSDVIANGFDPLPYGFVPRLEARARLGIDPNDRIICVGSHTVSNPYKGFGFAVKAIRSIADLNPLIIVLGNAGKEVHEMFSGLRVMAPGFLQEKSALSPYYSAADLMLFPSLADNLPIMIQESMAAATPVLAFRTGGIPELVTHSDNGWLVEGKNQEDLNAALRHALQGTESAALGLRAKARISKYFTIEDCVKKHLDLYQKTLAA